MPIHRILCSFGFLLLLLPTGAQEAAVENPESAPDPFGIWSTMRRVDELLGAPAELDWPRESPPVSTDPASEQLRGPALLSTDPWVRARAVESYATNLDDAALAKTIDALSDPDPDVRAAAVGVLRKATPSALAMALADRLTLGQRWEADAIYAALPQLRDRVAEPLLALFQSEGETTLYRQAAAWALGRTGGAGVGDALSAETWSDNMQLAEAAVQGLYLLHEKDRATEWSDLLLHASPNVRRMAMQALADQGDDLALQNIGMVARGEVGVEAAIQLMAVDMLAKWPFNECGPLILEAMKRNLTVRHRAWEHLVFRTGLELPEIPSQWEYAFYGPPQDKSQVPANLPITEDAPSELLREVNFVPPPMRGGVQIDYPAE